MGTISPPSHLKTIEAEGRTATPEEQETLSRYVGWGGIPQAFDADNASWSKEYAELVGALTQKNTKWHGPPP
jgi:hypothetical protein